MRWTSKAGHILKIRPGGSKKKYYRVNLHQNGKMVDRYVHRLVLDTFVGKPPTKNHQAAHQDGDSTNNWIGNLRWATPLSNTRDKKIHGTNPSGEKNPLSKITDDGAVEIMSRYLKGESSKYIAASFGVSTTTVVMICSRTRWSHIKISKSMEDSLKLKRQQNMDAPRNNWNESRRKK